MKEGKKYSEYFDSQGAYSQTQPEIKDIMNPLDSSERYTGIRVKVSTREKLKKWDAAKGYKKRRSFDDIILDVLHSKGYENLDSTMKDLTLIGKEVIKMILKGKNTTEEIYEEYSEGREISMRTVQHSVNSLLRKGVIFKKRKGNLTEYFIKKN